MIAQGTVRDINSHEVLVGAHIYRVLPDGKEIGVTVTNTDGFFETDLFQTDDQLAISHLGYKNKVFNHFQGDFPMNTAEYGIDEVDVVACKNGKVKDKQGNCVEPSKKWLIPVIGSLLFVLLVGGAWLIIKNKVV